MANHDFKNGFDDTIVQIRADTTGFARDVAAMRAELEGPLAQGAARAGRMIEGSLIRAIRTGNLGFEDLRRTALSVMADIAASAIRAGLQQLSGGGQSGSGAGNSGSGDRTGTGGLFGIGLGLLSSLLGSPGRAHGGGVSAGRSYRVGERGPELFVPGTTGRIEPLGRGSGPAPGRDIRITVNMAGGTPDRQRMAQTGKQIARSLRNALSQND